MNNDRQTPLKSTTISERREWRDNMVTRQFLGMVRDDREAYLETLLKTPLDKAERDLVARVTVGILDSILAYVEDSTKEEHV